MTLKRIIKNILKEEHESKREMFLIEYIDKKFENVLFVNDFDQNSRWFSKNLEELFIRNWWGMLWVADCEFYNDLRQRDELFEFSLQEFHEILVKYMNKEYQKDFRDRPLRDVGDENNCSELEWQ